MRIFHLVYLGLDLRSSFCHVILYSIYPNRIYISIYSIMLYIHIPEYLIYSIGY
jgi:hypothetical protein